MLLRFLSLHYLNPQPGCVNMRQQEREYLIQAHAQHERPGVMNAGCGSDRFQYVVRNPALAVCGVHGINNTVCNQTYASGRLTKAKHTNRGRSNIKHTRAEDTALREHALLGTNAL